MLDQEILVCELARNRYKQIQMKYHYGMDRCDDCDDIVKKYTRYLALDLLSACGVPVHCPKITGTACAQYDLLEGCAVITVSREEVNISTPQITIR